MKRIVLAPAMPSAESVQEDALLRSIEAHKSTVKKFNRTAPHRHKRTQKNRYTRAENQDSFLLPFIESKRGTYNNESSPSYLDPIAKLRQISLINRVLSTEGNRSNRKHYRPKMPCKTSTRFHRARKSISEDFGPVKDWKLTVIQPKDITNAISITGPELCKLDSMATKTLKETVSKKKQEETEDNAAGALGFKLQLYQADNELFEELLVELTPKGKTIKLQECFKDMPRLKEYLDKVLKVPNASLNRSQSPPVLASKPLVNEPARGSIHLETLASIRYRPTKGLQDSVIISSNPQSSLVIKGTASLPKEKAHATIAALASAKTKLGNSIERAGGLDLYKKCVPFASKYHFLESALKVNKKTKKRFIEDLLKDTAHQSKVDEVIKETELYVTHKGTIILRPREELDAAATEKPQNSPRLGLSHPSKSVAYKILESLSTPQKPKVQTVQKVQATPRVVKSEATGRKSALRVVRKSSIGNAEDVPSVPASDCTTKPETLIKVLHKDYTHHKDHPINRIIGLINKFGELTFRNKESIFDAPKCLKLAKAIGIPLLKDSINAQTLKSRDLSHPLKERILKQFWNVLNAENRVSVTQGEKARQQYKFCVCRGNNSMLVKSILKRRFWWTYAGKKDEGLNLLWTQWCRSKFVKALPTLAPSKEKSLDSHRIPVVPSNVKMCNHLERHYHLSNKKAMFVNMVNYYRTMKQNPFDTLPLTFHIQNGVADPEFDKFAEHFHLLETEVKNNKEKGKGTKNVWIVKPGEYSNRGHGIQVLSDFEDIRKTVGSAKGPRTFIVQKYIEHPLLVNKRKFDIRMFGLLTGINGNLKGYFYEEGYIRTSSKEFSLKNLSNKAVHLTNDAVQQKEEDYGKFEAGNKLSFVEFQKYLDTSYGSLHVDFARDLLPQIKKIMTDTFRAVHAIIDPYKRQHTFEIYGYDFMIDTHFKVYLIEVNTNPCLEVSSPLLGRVITNMLDNALKQASITHQIELQWILYSQYPRLRVNVLPSATFCQK
eukprot:TRINITY_DN542_c0_g1_i1.p1 TRINITY_DN542_c0_g1~~TRINITY_DN542_c0_g1_i1.p1  ORF type:complete len:1002 (+),score=71.85 TRINITY_DN542_c0_g1_i1:11821-14826(+)